MNEGLSQMRISRRRLPGRMAARNGPPTREKRLGSYPRGPDCSLRRIAPDLLVVGTPAFARAIRSAHEAEPQNPPHVSQDSQPAVSLEGLTFTAFTCSHGHIAPQKVAAYCSLLQDFGPSCQCILYICPLTVIDGTIEVLVQLVAGPMLNTIADSLRQRLSRCHHIGLLAHLAKNCRLASAALKTTTGVRPATGDRQPATEN
jgi:hypothetical protein